MKPFLNLSASYKSSRSAIDAAVHRVLSSGHYILGSEVAAFETEFARFLGSRNAVGVANGTDAITLSLIALGIGAGDEVLIPDLTAYPTAVGVMRSGATAVLVDVRPEDGLIDPTKIEEKISRRTRAIVPVHLYGQSCDMDPILRLARKHRLRVIEDCAQSSGASYRGRKAGTMGDCGAFSFYPTKNLAAFGDGGAVVTRHREVNDRVRRLRFYGQSRTNVFDDPRGFNSRLDEIQAAVLRVQLRKLETENARRRHLAGLYRKGLGSACLIERAYGVPVYHQFVIRVMKREDTVAALNKAGIATMVHYPIPIHEQAAFEGKTRSSYPAASALTASILSLPINPHMTDAAANKMIKIVRKVLSA